MAPPSCHLTPDGNFAIIQEAIGRTSARGQFRHPAYKTARSRNKRRENLYRRAVHVAAFAGAMAYSVALAALFKKNLRLFLRDYPSLIIQFAATFLAILVLFLSQVSLDSDNTFSPELRADPTPESTPLPAVPRCIPLEFDDCYTIAYVPAGNSDVERYVSRVAAYSGIPDEEVQGHASTATLNAELLRRPNRTQAAYVFEESDLNALAIGNISFIIQLNSTAQQDFPFGTTDFHERIVGPAMLHIMNKVLMDELSGVPLNIKYEVSVFPHPDLPGIADAFSDDGPLLLYGVYFLSLVLFLYKIVDEKERGMRDYMRLSGLQQVQHYLSWGVPFMLSFLLTTLLVCLWGTIFRFKFFTKTNFLVYFITFIVFGFALVGWTFLLETVTRKRAAVSLVAFNAFIFSYLVASAGSYVYLQDSDGELVVTSSIGPILQKLFACLPPVMFTKAIQDIAQLAATGFGLSFKNVGSYTDVYPVRDSWKWMAGSGFVALLLAMYLDNVVSTPTSKGLSLLYLFSPKYWGFGQNNDSIVARRRREGERNGQDTGSDVEGDAFAAANSISITYDGLNEDTDVTREREAIDSGNRNHRPLVIQNVVKKYGSVAAVNGLYLSVPRDSVTAILGPNGCGKSTTLRLLSTQAGLNSGDIRIYGKSVRTDATSIRKTLGLCPQTDVAFDLLTAAEHVDLFAALKGMSKADCKLEVERRLEEVGLTGAATRYARTFSGGMLRRLSVCLALTGDPAIVALDEASTGTDPISRRDLWTIIEKAKHNRIILLITHSMEEAEALSDQIAIMGDGKLKTIGTSLHLKNKLGAGYGLTASTKTLHAADTVLEVLVAQAPGSRLEKVSGRENGRPDAVIAEYALPRHMTDADMATIVKSLEQRKEELDIARFSVNHTTLDSVFKRIAALSKERDEDADVKKGCCKRCF